MKLRLIEIAKGQYKGRVGLFHGFFIKGNLEGGLSPIAVIELGDGEVNEFDAEYVKFLDTKKELQK